LRRKKNLFQKLTGERERERRVASISLLHRRERKKLDPGEKERGALESENCWEEEIKTNIYIYIYIYIEIWAFHNLSLTKKKKIKNKIDMVKTKIELLGIVKQRKKENTLERF
jgi:hypothetical protein